MRASGVSDGAIAELLGLLPRGAGSRPVPARVRQRLDRLERRDRLEKRDGRARQHLAYVTRSARRAFADCAARGVDPFMDVAGLRAAIVWLEALVACHAAEAACGDPGAWLPEYIYRDPVGEGRRELAAWRELLRRAEREAEQAQDRARQERRLDAQQQVARMSPADYRRLPAAEREQIERAFGLDIPDDPPAGADAMGRLRVPYIE